MGSEGKPSLPMRKGGYNIIPIVLEEKPPDYYPKFGLQDYSIDFQEKEKNMRIGKPIILERENVAR